MIETQQRNDMPGQSRPGSTTTMHPNVRLQGGGNKYVTGVNTTIRLPKGGTTIGIWNTYFLHACRKAQKLTHELKHYRWDIPGLAEVRWTRFGNTTMDEGHKDLGLWRRLKTPVQGDNHCTERSCRLYHQWHSHLQQTRLYPDLSEMIQQHSQLGLRR